MGVTQVVQCLPSKHEVLSSIPITRKRKENICVGQRQEAISCKLSRKIFI
jgi:hypothetical protein